MTHSLSIFVTMFRMFLAGLILLFVLSVRGQNQTNPFDLSFRTPKPKTAINRAEPASAPDTIVKKEIPVIIESADTAKVSQIQTDTSVRSVGNNPFDLGRDDQKNTGKIAVLEDKPLVTEVSPVKETVEMARPSRGIQIFFLLLSLLFLIFIVNVERSFVKDLWRVISNENYSSLHLRNQRNTMRQILLFMGYAVFIIQAGIFIYHVLALFNYNGTLLDNIWICIALVFMVYLVRHSVIRYLRWLFNNDKEMTLYSFDISIFNIMVGLVLLPINVMLNFGPESLSKPLIIIGIIVMVIAYAMRQLRWFFTARQLITNSLFLFFVYLCAVELLPLWAISKYFW